MIDLLGKRILLFVPSGRGIYGTGITKELESRGAIVNIYDERPATSVMAKAALRLAKGLIKPYLYTYFKNIVNDHKNADYNYILIIRGESITPGIVRMLRKAYKNATLILYLWDSLKATDIQITLPFFDRVLSFDKEDTDRHPGIIFRPLFYLPHYENIAEVKERPIDVLFIGTVHSDRYSIIKGLQKVFIDSDIKSFFYFYFPSRLLFLINKLTDRAFIKSTMSDFRYKMMTAEQAAFYMSQAKASLDVEGPKQTGLTMRTIEVLGSKRKLITTNGTIRYYDFYDEKNIYIMDRNNPKIDLEFIQTPFHEIDPKIYGHYSIKAWVDELFVDSNQPYLKNL